MTTLFKHTVHISSLLILTILACSSALAQHSQRPDLEGTYSNASLTSLNRRTGVEALIVSPEEARILAANQLGEIAAELENHARDDQLDAVRSRLGEIEAAVDQACGIIKAWRD